MGKVLQAMEQLDVTGFPKGPIWFLFPFDSVSYTHLLYLLFVKIGDSTVTENMLGYCASLNNSILLNDSIFSSMV